MFKFTTATILAAGATAVSLGTSTLSGDPIDWDRIGDDIYGRTENTFGVLDINNDEKINISEMSEVVLMAENAGYIDHDEARYLAWVIAHLFYHFDEDITLDEIDNIMDEIISESETDFPYEHILDLIEYMEEITLLHGHRLDFYKFDQNGNNLLEPKELYDAGLSRHRHNYEDDSRRNGHWDWLEYGDYVMD